jgi:excisionase family DNA binding protein
MYSVKEASSRLGINERHVRRLLVSGKIKGKKLGHDWIVLDLNYTRKRKPKGGEKQNGVRGQL